MYIFSYVESFNDISKKLFSSFDIKSLLDNIFSLLSTSTIFLAILRFSEEIGCMSYGQLRLLVLGK